MRRLLTVAAVATLAVSGLLVTAATGDPARARWLLGTARFTVNGHERRYHRAGALHRRRAR